jgi:hypothetical protein
MTPIGGFFELELPRGTGPYHPGAMALTCGRACLRHALAVLAPRHVYVPFYTCDAVPEAVTAAGVPWTFYPVNEQLEPLSDPQPGPAEVVVYVNYFGLKGEAARALAARLGPALIVDDTQAFFARGYPGSWSFNSARKFFGVPDGAYLYAPVPLPPVVARNENPEWEYLTARLAGHQEAAYRKFQASEAAVTSEVRRLSIGAERMLAGIDYQAAALRRRANFAAYHDGLGRWNCLALRPDPEAVPLCYPFLPAGQIRREVLYAQEIYPPRYWAECGTRAGRGFDWERELSDRLLPLPVDQRYGVNDVARVVRAVRDLLGV